MGYSVKNINRIHLFPLCVRRHSLDSCAKFLTMIAKFCLL